MNANDAEQTPDEKAASIINSVPSSSLWTKTGGVVLGTAVTAAAVSTELYVRFRGIKGM
jgi:F-type H+-transporting ATPase subunit b